MWRFFWYPDGTSNPWQTWYSRQDAKVRGKHDIVFRMLLGQRELRGLHAKKLTDCDGLVEIIITTDVAHRLLGFHGLEQHDFTIVLPCTHKGRSYMPKSAIKTAIARMNQIKQHIKVAIPCDKPK